MTSNELTTRQQEVMEDGIIELDTRRGDELGLLSSKFSAGSYLWKKEGAIIISFIESRQKGNFRQLVERILSLGFSVHVPTPLPMMERIVKKCGYRQTTVENAFGAVEVWILDPPKGQVIDECDVMRELKQMLVEEE